ncbi:linker histone H1 and H5 family protein [Dictyocaulus viviparus]|uniref:Linker histone H1 and H5 family protein n=1 Tax=Dictyocaulus viviparus TaxID=29172 RepID=A0A0D8XNK3_DICVI|nr:linker histone H1 and H5 family protein [Dictyocaulus viviparus]
MSEAATVPAQKTKKNKPKVEKKSKTTPSHPMYGDMIMTAINEIQDRKGASKQAIAKFIQQKYKLGDNEKKINAHLRMALKKGVIGGKLTQASGTGAAGRFRVAQKSESSNAVKAKMSAKPKLSLSPKKSPAKPKKLTKHKVKLATKSKTPKKSVKAMTPKKPIIKKIAKPKTAKKPTVKKTTFKA